MDYASRRQSANVEDRRNESGMLGAVRDFGRNFYSELTRPSRPIVAQNRYTDAIERRAQEPDGPANWTPEKFFREAEMQREMPDVYGSGYLSGEAKQRILRLKNEVTQMKIARSRRPETVPQD